MVFYVYLLAFLSLNYHVKFYTAPLLDSLSEKKVAMMWYSTVTV